jgi:hypothetical protein
MLVPSWTAEGASLSSGIEMTRTTIASVLEAKGEARGEAKGVARGVIEGSIDTLIENIKIVLESKFDNFGGDKNLYTKLDLIRNKQKLTTILKYATVAKSIDDFIECSDKIQ